MAYGRAGGRYNHGPRLVAKKPIPEALTMEQLTVLGEKYPDSQERAIFYFLYLTGCRVTEALRARVQDLKRESTQAWGDIVTARLSTVKNRRTRFRVVPIPLKEAESPMVDYIYNYIGGGRDPEDLIFSLSRTNVWNRLAKEEVTVRAVHGRNIIEDYRKKINPHYLRHCRLTHLVQFYGFNDTQLTRFAGWTSSEPAQIYVHLDWQDLAKVMHQKGVS